MSPTATSIYIASPEGETGKSTIALGLLHRLSTKVPKVGVFRPITRREERDYILELLLSQSDAGLTYEECVGVSYQRLHEDPTDPDSPLVTADEGMRADPNPEKMATLKPVFAADGATTAANSSQISDGAAALLIASRAYAQQHGLKPRARFVSTAVAAADPVIQFTAVLDATRKALKESGLTPADIDLFEVNEAFGGVPLMFQQEFGIPDDRLNVNGGSVAIGHPLGSTGARMLTDLLCELERRGGRYGLQTICEASGTANTTIIERLA